MPRKGSKNLDDKEVMSEDEKRKERTMKLI